MTPVSLTYEDNRFTIRGGHAAGHDDVYKEVTKWAGWRRIRTKSETGMYQGPDSAYSASKILTSQLTITWEKTAHEIAQNRIRELAEAEAILRGTRNVPPIAMGGNRQPFPHQCRAVHALERLHFRALLSDEMGLGKTAECLWAWQRSGVRSLVVVCPKAARHVWKREVANCAGQGTEWIVLEGTPKRRADAFVSLEHWLKEEIQVGVSINYDLLAHLTERQFDILSLAARFLVLDESHYVKNPSSNRSKEAKRLATAARHVICASGTPIRDSILDVYHQVQLVRPGTWTGVTEFKRRYCTFDTVFARGTPQEVLNKTAVRNEPDLRSVLAQVQIWRKKEDVLDLPPKIHSTVQLEMDKETERAYNKMAHWSLTHLEGLDDSELVYHPTCKNAREVMLRLEQLAQGIVGNVPDDLMQLMRPHLQKHGRFIPGREREYVLTENSKLNYALETVEDILYQGAQVVIFSRFNAPLIWLHHKMPKQSILFVGGEDIQQREKEFQSGAKPVALTQIKIAEGFDLWKGTYALFLGREWAPGPNLQAEDRLHRIGQRGTVNVLIPIMTNTVEEEIDKRLQLKAANRDNVMSNLTVGELRRLLGEKPR